MKPRKLKVVRFPIVPGSAEWLELRKQDVTASVVGALFGFHPYETPAGLWAEKTGTDMPPPSNPLLLERGLDFEEVIAKRFVKRYPDWKYRQPKVYLRAPNIGLGATPDFFLTHKLVSSRRAVLQCKTVNPYTFKREWTETTAPTWIVLQTLCETMLAKYECGFIACLVIDGYHYDLHVYEVPRHYKAEYRIQEAVLKFWNDVAHGREPQIDYTRDGGLLNVMWPHTVEDKIVDLRADNELPELLDEQATLDEGIKQSEERVKAIRNELKAKMKDAEIALIGGGWRATLREQKREGYVVKPTNFRVLRLTKEKQKAA